MAAGFGKGRADETGDCAWEESDILAELEVLFQVAEEGMVAVNLLWKRKIHSESMKIQWFVNNCTKVRQNTLFNSNQRHLYKMLGGGQGKLRANPTTSAGEATRFWSGILGAGMVQ